jgi:sulfotransferase family protein
VTARDRLRATFFRTLRRAFETDDGRQIASDSLAGLLAWRPKFPVLDAASPYPDLGHATDAPADLRAGTIFITARFRTGSTLLWQMFRQTDSCVAYYEPLNNRRWFDPSTRGDRIDPTHRGVDDYWREYEGLSDLGQWHRVDWTTHRLFMDETAWDPGLRRYLGRLIEHAAPKRAVLQCNRIDFRLPWLRRQFPQATFLHLYRHPRDQWCSSLLDFKTMPRDTAMDRFDPYDHFYLRRWALDLQQQFPFLGPRAESSPYRVFYFLWKLSYLFGRAHADHSLAFEDLIRSPKSEIQKLTAVVSLDADPDRLATLVTDVPLGRWRQFADDSWFRAHEAACEDVLAEFFRGQR